MNYVQRRIPELELPVDAVQEALQCILNTILFARWPDEVKPYEIQCKHFNGMAYTSCGDKATMLKINAAIREFMNSLIDAGPDLEKGSITLTFFKRRMTKVAFNLWQVEEKVNWEEWVIPLLVSSAPQPISNKRIENNERQSLQRESDMRNLELLQERMTEIIILLNESVDHIPPPSENSHDFEFSYGAGGGGNAQSGGAGGEGEGGAAYRPRVLSAPPVSMPM
jgi:hypothetical protein